MMCLHNNKKEERELKVENLRSWGTKEDQFTILPMVNQSENTSQTILTTFLIFT